MKKILLLPHKDYFFDQYSEYVEVHYIFREIHSKFILILRRIHFKLLSCIYSIWFSNTLKRIDFNAVDKVIIFDSLYSIDVANYLKKKYSRLDVSVCYRNHLEKPSEINKTSYDIKIWSYDKDDCVKYGLNYNPQFYFSSLSCISNYTTCDIDFLFIGQVKGRGQIINEVQTKLTNLGFKVFFHVINEKNKKSPDYKYLDYKDVVDLIKRSKCVVDIVGEWQTGMTLRPLEALFDKKKLLTNFVDIKHYDFYSPQNIFVYGEDNLDDLKVFINSPFGEESAKYVNKYNFPSWLNRF